MVTAIQFGGTRYSHFGEIRLKPIGGVIAGIFAAFGGQVGESYESGSMIQKRISLSPYRK